jgi:small subunit ribosomal protein S17
VSDRQAETTAAVRNERKVRQGVVVSDKMDKTVVVRVERRTIHPLYRKTITRSEKFHAHDETNDVHVGDTVRIVETRPLSKTKHWRVLEVLERAR